MRCKFKIFSRHGKHYKNLQCVYELKRAWHSNESFPNPTLFSHHILVLSLINFPLGAAVQQRWDLLCSFQRVCVCIVAPTAHLLCALHIRTIFQKEFRLARVLQPSELERLSLTAAESHNSATHNPEARPFESAFRSAFAIGCGHVRRTAHNYYYCCDCAHVSTLYAKRPVGWLCRSSSCCNNSLEAADTLAGRGHELLGKSVCSAHICLRPFNALTSYLRFRRHSWGVLCSIICKTFSCIHRRNESEQLKYESASLKCERVDYDCASASSNYM